MEKLVMSKVSRHIEADVDGDGIEDSTYIDSLPINKKNIITITGESGSGVSTVTDKLAQALEYRKFSAGALFRNLALQYDMSVEKLNEYAKSNRVIDQEIDTLIRRLGEGNEIILDSRLGFYWIHDSFKVFLTADRDIAARRIYEDIINGRRKGEKAVTIIEATASIQEQSESTMARYFRDYGIDISNTNSFDLIINTDHKTLDDVVALIRKHYKKWQRK
jgi:predicted cytidylate kinase